MSIEHDQSPLSRLPSTERLEELFDEVVEEIVHTVRVPEVRIPELTEVLDPWGMRHRARRGAEWVEDQLGPVAERFDAPSHRPPPPEPGRSDAGRDGPGCEEEKHQDDGWGLVEWFVFASFLEWLSERELSLSIDVDHALWSFDDEDDGRFELWTKSVFTPTVAHAARLGDPMMHGDVAAPGPGSPTVLIGGRPALRVCDVHLCTKATPVPHAGSGFRSTFGGVEIDGFAALRVGDFVDEGPHGPNPIVAGCPTVTIGPVAPAVECISSDVAEPIHRPEHIPFRWRKGEIGHFEGKVVLGVGLDGPFLRVEGTVTAARLWAEETATRDVPLGDVDGDGNAEALRVTVTTKSERVLGVSEVELELHPVARRIDRATVAPKGRDALPPPQTDVTTRTEIVELP